MTNDRMPGLFAAADGGGHGTVLEYPNTGVLSYRGLRTMRQEGQISAVPDILQEQYQPASLDLRLGQKAYRVRASFLPGRHSPVMQKVEELDGLPAIHLENGAVLERGAVYVVELLEHLKLPNELIGMANPKSSTGRLDVLTRLITNSATSFDRVEKKYEGPLFVEIAPQTFSVVVRTGTRLNQLRFYRGASPEVYAGQVKALYETGQLVKPCGPLLPLRDGDVPVSVDLRGTGPGSIVGYKARKNTNKIDFDRVGHYDPRDFWEKIEASNGRINLDQGDFYILATCEDVGVPPNLAAEMVPYDSAAGEFRVHYAGFFDPGFGYVDGRAQGSKAVLEVRSYGVSFTLEHGQVIGWLRYSRLAGPPPEKVYGEGIKSNYQGQGVALAKHFKPWRV
jgi:dCTP deaminase